MLFNSTHFLIFFAVILILYALVPRGWRWLLLLIGSYFFYASWDVRFLSLILLSTGVDYGVARSLSAEDRTPRARGWLLAISLTVNLGVLMLFKYYDFFALSLVALLSQLGITVSIALLNVTLPVGISFYTFQTMGYTIDVYRRKTEAERHLGYFALYVTFFPQLVAGPIERASRLLPQFRENLAFDYDKAGSGLRLILWGLFLKMVVADNLAAFVKQVYAEPHQYEGVSLILATLFFTFQIYGDFAGYSYIAIGTARILGVDLMKNFRQPYFSTSLQEFWQRWHISLSTWFRDYLYIPLGGSRVPFPRYLFNLAVVFVISGLWHGASWTFVIWGAIHALFFVGEVAASHLRKPDPKPALPVLVGRWVLVNGVVIAAWVFFRADTAADALYILTHAFRPGSADIVALLWTQQFGIWLIAIVASGEFIYIYLLKRNLDKLPGWTRWPGYALLCLAILNYSAIEQVPFIYFQF